MAVLRRGGWLTTAAALLTCAILAVMIRAVSSTRFLVGANMGWTSNVNYTIWARDKRFYLEDWLFFVYDRNQMNVLEVNKTDYVSCNSDHPLHNWTTGAGRDVVPLNVTGDRYFISGKGFCYGGMKVAIHTEKLPPPPKASPVKSSSSTFRNKIAMPALFVIGAAWDSFLLFW